MLQPREPPKCWDHRHMPIPSSSLWVSPASCFHTLGQALCSLFLCLFSMYFIFIYVCVCAHACRCLRKPEGTVGSPAAEAMGSRVLGIELGSSAREIHTLNPCTIFPALFNSEARETAQRWRALPEDPGSVPSHHVLTTVLNSRTRESNFSFWPPQALQARDAQPYIQRKHPYT